MCLNFLQMPCLITVKEQANRQTMKLSRTTTLKSYTKTHWLGTFTKLSQQISPNSSSSQCSFGKASTFVHGMESTTPHDSSTSNQKWSSVALLHAHLHAAHFLINMCPFHCGRKWASGDKSGSRAWCFCCSQCCNWETWIPQWGSHWCRPLATSCLLPVRR